MYFQTALVPLLLYYKYISVPKYIVSDDMN